MIDHPEISLTEARSAAVVHLTVPRDELRAAWGPALEEIMEALRAQGIEPDGPVFAHHLRMYPEAFDVELGVPTARAVEARGRVVAGGLPATKVVRAIYYGPYEDLASGWAEVGAWIQSQGCTVAADLWESYLVGPGSGKEPSQWRTELVRPLAE